MRLRKLLPLLLLPLLACGSGADRRDQSVFHSYLGEEPQSLDPPFAVDQASGLLVSLIYPGLFRFLPDGEALPDLARDWSLSEDQRIYTMHLHTDRRFDDGAPIRSHDVLRCFLRLLDPARPSPRRWVLGALLGADEFRAGHANHVAGLRAPDDSTLVLELVEPFSPFPGLLAMPATRIYPAAEDGAPARAGGLPLGAGPWRMSEWRRGDSFMLARNVPCPAGGFSALEFRIIPQPFTAGAEFSVGNLDLLRVPLAELSYWMEEEGMGTLLRQEELVVSYIGLNTQKAPFDDHRVRQALNYAIDVEALIRTARAGAARRALGPVPPSLRSEDPGELFLYRPERARALLAEAGYPDGFEMELWQKENPEVSRILETIQVYLSEVGVRARIVVRDWGAFKDAVNKGSADAFFLDWLADYPDAENFLQPLFHSSNFGGGGNRARFSDPLSDILLDELRSTPAGPARERLVNHLNESIYRKAPWIWLWHPVSLQVIATRIDGYRPPLIFNGQDYLEARYDAALSDP